MPIKQSGKRKLALSPESASGISYTDADIDQIIASAGGKGGPLPPIDLAVVQPKIDNLANRMRPSDWVAYHALKHVITPPIEELLVQGHTLCVAVHCEPSWSITVGDALAFVLAEVAVRQGVGMRLGIEAYMSDVRGVDGERFDADNVGMLLAKSHVALVVYPGQDLDEAGVLVDVHAELRIDAPLLEHVIRQRLPNASWPRSVDVRLVAARHFDLAIGRAQDGTHLAAMLKALTGSVEQKAAVHEGHKEAKAAANAKPGRRITAADMSWPVSPKLEDLHGLGPVQPWGLSLAADLALYRAGKLGWQDVDAGCVLHGPPGTGKTTAAAAIAASAGVAFVSTSYAQWQAHREGHLGHVTKAIREVFEMAAEAAPCILFIDEIDTLPARGSGTTGLRGGDDWWSAIVNALLECLDGSSRREGLVVLAACNNASNLDPALVRSGRLDRMIEIPLPGEDALTGIFQHHLPGIDAGIVAPAATALAGSISGADVARMAREARRVARRADREVSAEDLLAIALPAETRPASAVWRTAVHEAGHAVACIVRGRMPQSLSLISSGGAHGGVRGSGPTGDGMGLLVELEDEVVIALAGRAAEEVVLGEACGGSGGSDGSDLHHATSVVKSVIGIFGLGGRLLHDRQVHGDVVETRLRDLYGRALRLIGERRADVEALACLAVEKRVLPAKALAAFAEERGLRREEGR